MAHITKRKRSDGVIIYDAALKITKNKRVIHREKRSFLRHQLAKDWSVKRQAEIQHGIVHHSIAAYPIKKVIHNYLNTFNISGRSKLSDLNRLARSSIAEIDVNALTVNDVVLYIRSRNDECLPQTANIDLIWLQTVISTMQAVDDSLAVDLTLFNSARKILKSTRLVAKSVERTRRPTSEELWTLSRHFPPYMLYIMWFAIYSTRRQSEITRLRWDDIQNNTILVRDLKHPNIKGLSKRAALPKSARKIIAKQPQISEFIFPKLHYKTIGTYFTRACHALNIKDLRFHDLRHHGISILAERGLSSEQLKLVSLHQSSAALSRYINLKAEDLDI
jgi:integrase